MTAKVLIIVGDATETVDTLYPYLRVQEEGFVPVVAGPEARRYNMVLHEVPAEGWDLTREFEGIPSKRTSPSATSCPQSTWGSFSLEGAPRNTSATTRT